MYASITERGIQTKYTTNKYDYFIDIQTDNDIII